MANSFYSLSAKDIFGRPIDFEALRGKVVLIMNIPFECRFSDKIYQDLQGLEEELSGLQTFKILLFMSDQFGGLYLPCDEKYITKNKKKLLRSPFQIIEKTDVVGKKSHPVFEHLIKETQIKPKANFYAYLIDSDGTLVEVFPPSISLIHEAYDIIFKCVKTTMDNAMSEMENMIGNTDMEEE
jgi:glutathione peroxidase